MTNAQVGMIAGAIVIAAAIIGFAVSGERQQPTPKARAEGAAEFVKAVAESFPTVTETVKVEIVRTAILFTEKELALYAEKHEGRYPESLDALGSALQRSDMEFDIWGRAYHYAVNHVNGNGKPYDLHSLGPDGLDGTADDVYAQVKK